jgi:hypothetical protein
MPYILSNITPLGLLGKRELGIVDKAMNEAYESDFNASMRLGAFLVPDKGQCILRG